MFADQEDESPKKIGQVAQVILPQTSSTLFSQNSALGTVSKWLATLHRLFQSGLHLSMEVSQHAQTGQPMLQIVFLKLTNIPFKKKKRPEKGMMPQTSMKQEINILIPRRTVDSSGQPMDDRCCHCLIEVVCNYLDQKGKKVQEVRLQDISLFSVLYPLSLLC